MSKAKDFSEDLAIVSKAVASDVDAIVKIVRQKDAGEGESHEPLPLAAPIIPDMPSAASSVTPRTMNQRTMRVRKSNLPAPVEGIPLDNVTTRLRRDTNELLTEAALHQKLKKVHPNTRQDIIEEALQDWLRRHSYLTKFHDSD